MDDMVLNGETPQTLGRGVRLLPASPPADHGSNRRRGPRLTCEPVVLGIDQAVAETRSLLRDAANAAGPAPLQRRVWCRVTTRSEISTWSGNRPGQDATSHLFVQGSMQARLDEC